MYGQYVCAKVVCIIRLGWMDRSHCNLIWYVYMKCMVTAAMPHYGTFITLNSGTRQPTPRGVIGTAPMLAALVILVNVYMHCQLARHAAVSVCVCVCVRINE